MGLDPRAFDMRWVCFAHEKVGYNLSMDPHWRRYRSTPAGPGRNRFRAGQVTRRRSTGRAGSHGGRRPRRTGRAAHSAPRPLGVVSTRLARNPDGQKIRPESGRVRSSRNAEPRLSSAASALAGRWRPGAGTGGAATEVRARDFKLGYLRPVCHPPCSLLRGPVLTACAPRRNVGH